MMDETMGRTMYGPGGAGPIGVGPIGAGPIGAGPIGAGPDKMIDRNIDDHPGTPMLVCRNLSKTYGSTPALRNVDLTLLSGRIVGLVGPNGSGKTTLDRKSTRLNSSHPTTSRMPSSA